MALTRYWSRMKRLDALATAYEPRVRRALIRGCERAAEAVAQGASPAVAAAYFQNAFLVEVLSEIVTACGLAEAQDEYDHLTTKYPRKSQAPPGVRDSWTARLRRFIQTEGATAIRSITETVRKKVRDVLSEAAQAGLGVAEAARELRAQVADFSVSQAVSIARTELIGASNVGSLMGAEATGLQLDKYWIATPGSRTRPTHAAANRQTVALQDFFTVGGEHARYPGDPLLSARERIRCRCSIGYKPKGE